MFLASRTDFRLLRYLAIPLYVGTLVLLVAVLIPGIGDEAFGSRRWIVIPGIGSFQPAELAKLAICIYLAHWLDRRGTRARSFWNGFVPFGLLVAPGFLLIALEPDLGTAGVYAVTALSIFFMAGANLLYLGAIAAGVIGAAVAHDQQHAVPAAAGANASSIPSATRWMPATTRSRVCWRWRWAAWWARGSAPAA